MCTNKCNVTSLGQTSYLKNIEVITRIGFNYLINGLFKNSKIDYLSEAKFITFNIVLASYHFYFHHFRFTIIYHHLMQH